MIPSTPRSSSRRHLIGVVDRPHVDLDAPPVHPLDEAVVDHREPAAAHRHLRRQRSRPRPSDQPQRGQLGRSGPGAQPVAEPAPQPEQPPVAERADTDPVEDLGAGELVRQRVDRPVGLAVDVPPDVRPGARAARRGGGSAPDRRPAPLPPPATAARRSGPVARTCGTGRRRGRPRRPRPPSRGRRSRGSGSRARRPARRRAACSPAPRSAPPRWANAIGPGQSRNGWRGGRGVLDTARSMVGS